MILCRIDLDVARMDSPISSASSQTTVGPQMDLNSTFADEASSIMLASNNDTTSVIILTSTESSYGGGQPSVSNISLTSMIGDEGGKIT